MRTRSSAGAVIVALSLGLAAACAVSPVGRGDGVADGGASALELASHAPVTPEARAVPVVSVTDGDTIVVRRRGREEPVRLLGINAPESPGGYRQAQCFGTEAKDRVAQLAAGTAVILATDPTQDRVDKHGRLLAYVWLPDGTLLNRLLLSEGHANEYTYDRADPYALQKEFRAARDVAERAGRGLWSPTGCDGEFDAALPDPDEG